MCPCQPLSSDIGCAESEPITAGGEEEGELACRDPGVGELGQHVLKQPSKLNVVFMVCAELDLHHICTDVAIRKKEKTLTALIIKRFKHQRDCVHVQ